MLIKKERAIKKQNSENCIAYEYEYPDLDSSIAVAEVNGRYPESGKSVNLECKQVYYVISGSGIIFSEKGEFEIKEGDLYFFEKKESYYVDGKNLKVCIMNSPKWMIEQYKSIP
jgi:mannose-6-phosphate isomerase-like protein (cupin superfamily)